MKHFHDDSRNTFHNLDFRNSAIKANIVADWVRFDKALNVRPSHIDFLNKVRDVNVMSFIDVTMEIINDVVMDGIDDVGVGGAAAGRVL